MTVDVLNGQPLEVHDIRARAARRYRSMSGTCSTSFAARCAREPGDERAAR